MKYLLIAVLLFLTACMEQRSDYCRSIQSFNAQSDGLDEVFYRIIERQNQ